jgi:outer membrane receptor protein involved in Fe transport
MIRYILIASVVLSSGYILQAQTKLRVTGTVVEFQTKEPLQYANIVLSKDTDSSLVAGAVTNEDGNFHFDNIKRGRYFITASFIGFEKVETPVFELTGNIYVGKLAIKKLSILLDEVNVISEKNTLESTLDKKVYNVGKDIISESSSVSEILQNIPSVSVDINGNVSLRGTTNINFLMNGNPSSRLRRNAPVALQQIPSNTVERIEIITNPSAKYNPEGTGGIINIVTRKVLDKGINGQIIGNIGNDSRYNTNLSLSYNQNDLSSFFSYSLRKPSQTNVYSDLRIKKDISTGQKISEYSENGSSYTDPLAHIFDAGINYQLTEGNNFELSGNYFSQNSLHQGSSDIIKINNQNKLEDQVRSSNTNDEYEREGEGAFTFEHLFNGNEDHNLVLEATYAGYDESEDLTFVENSVYPNYESTAKKILVKKNGHQTELVAEYAQPIDNESDFETGYSGEFIRDDILYNTNGSGNRFLFDQNINSFYALYSRDINNFSLEVGMRGEMADITSHLVQPNDISTNNNYFKFYPSGLLAYEIDQTENVKISYSKRINRPDADQLNPFPEYTDPRNAEAGNPNLKPEQIHSFELGYQKIFDSFTISPSLFYRYKYDAFTTVSKLQGDSTVIITNENLSDQQAAGIEGIISGNKKCFEF